MKKCLHFSLLLALYCLLYVNSNAQCTPVAVTKTNSTKVYVHYMPWFAGPINPSATGSYTWGPHWYENGGDNSNTPNTFTTAFDSITGTTVTVRNIDGHYHPLIGPYDETDPYVEEYHLLLMKLSGIDGIMIDWYGLGGNGASDAGANQTNTAAMISQVGKYGLKYGLVMEDAAWSNAQANGNFAVANYFTDPNYIKLGDMRGTGAPNATAPLVAVFGPQQFKSPGQWNTILSGNTKAFLPLYGQAAQIGTDAGGTFMWPYPQAGQGGSPPAWYDNTADYYTGTGNYVTYTDGGAVNLHNNTKEGTTPLGNNVLLATGYQGFNDFYGGGGADADGIIPRNYGSSGNTLQTTLALAQSHSSEIDAIQIATWNDYSEGTIIEPTVEFGFKSLVTVQQFTGVSYVEKDLRYVDTLYMLRKQYTGSTAQDITIQAALNTAACNFASGNVATAESTLSCIVKTGTTVCAVGPIVNITAAGSPSEDGTPGTFTISATGITANITVNYSIGGTTAAGHYTASPLLSGTVTLSVATPSVTFTITPIHDNVYDPNQTLQLTVNTGTGYTPGTNTATLTILDIDVPTCSTNMIVDAPSAPTIDGTVDAIWAKAPLNPITKTISGTIQTGSTWQAMYDATNLYVLITVKDTNTSNIGTNIYDQDGVELFLAGNNSKAGAYTANDHQYRFNWNEPATIANITGTTGTTTGITYAIPSSPGGYTLEVSIPWTTIGGTAPYNGKPIGFDININDQQNNAGPREATVGWNGTAGDDYMNTADFGTVNLTTCNALAVAPVVTTNTATGTVGTSFTYTITATNSPTSYGASAMPAGLSFNSTTGAITGTPTATGTFTISDTAKNTGGTGTGTVTITINPAKPVVTSNTANGTVGSVFSYTISATNTPTSYGASAMPGGLSFNPASGTISGTPTTTGTFIITDTASNISGAGSGTVTITINPAIPVITSAPAMTIVAGSLLNYTITATHSPTSFGVSTLPFGLTFNPITGLISGSSFMVGTFFLTDTAKNISGAGTGIFVLTINPPSPVVTPGTATGTVGTGFSYSIFALNSPTSYSSGTLPAGLTLNTTTGAISGTPTISGTFIIPDTAKNVTGFGAGIVTITINPAKPVVTSNTTSGTVGLVFSYTISATNTPTNYGTSVLPGGLSFNPATGTISGTPTTTGSFTINDTAYNISGAGTGTVTITINPAIPVVTSNTVIGTVGTSYTYTISATSTVTSYSASAMPGGLSFNPASGTITGTPTTTGTFTINDTARNISGAGAGTITIIINPAIPVITSVPSIVMVGGTLLNYTITATHSPTSFGISTLPPGLLFNPLTGTITGTTFTIGTFFVTDTARNISGAGTGIISITIIPPPPIVITGTATGTVGIGFSYSIIAFNSPTSYSSGTLPGGLTLNTTTGVISGTPTVFGTFIIPDTAKNVTGSGPGTVTITINPATPVVTSNSAAGTIGTSFTYTISASNSPTSYGASTLPGGLTLNTATGVISGTPTATGTFIISDTAKNISGSGTGTVTITINPATPVVASASITGTFGLPFSYSISATNSPTSYGSTTLPVSLTLNTVTGVISGIPNAIGTFTITDTAKNISGSGTGTLIITINPAIPVVTSNTTTGTVGSLFTYTVSATNTPTSYGATAMPGGLSFNPTTGVISGTPTATGTFTISDTAKNISGSGTGTITITINPAKPVVTTASVTGTVGQVFSYSIIATNSPTSYGTTTLPVSLTLNTTTGIISGIPTAVGTFTITDTAKNISGSGTGTLTITINPAVPVVTSTTTTGTVGAAFTYTIGATNTPTSYGASTLPNGLALSNTTGVISGIPTTAGTFTITDTAKNISGAGAGTITITINPAIPVLTAAVVNGTTGVTFSYTIAATNSPTSYSVSTLPGGLIFNTTTGTISGTPTLAGTFIINDTARNISGAAAGTITITITTILPPPPTITSGITTGTVGVAFSYTISATNSPTGYNSTTLPGGLTLNSVGLISGIPTAPGTFTVSDTAKNAGGNGTGTVTITINPAKPVVTAGSVTGTIGVPFSYSISATNSPTSYGSTTLPVSLTLNTTTGIISGIPNAVGTFTITDTAKNISGAGTNALTITVNPAIPVVSSGTASGTIGSLFTYSISATNTPTSYGVSTLPGGLTLNAATGAISGTPTVTGIFTITDTAKNISGAGTSTLTITINNAIPIVSSGSVNGTIGMPFSYSISATNSPTSYSSTTLPVSLTLNTTTGVISGIPNAIGTFIITDTAKNISGYGTGTITITITNAVPVVTSNLITGTVGSLFTYSISATNGPTSYGASTPLPGGLIFNSAAGTITGTPTIAGTFTVTDTAKNSSGAGSGTVIITINPAMPVVSSGTVTATIGMPFSYTISATNSPTSYSSTTLPVTLTLDPTTGVISGIPNAVGTFTITDTAKNISGSAIGTLTITINPAVPIVSSGSATGITGSLFTYSIIATNTPTSYGVSTLPGGLTLNTATGVISGTPTVTGAFTITDTAKNISGAGTSTLTITINSAVPVVTSGSVTGTIGLPFSYSINATNGPTSYASTTLPVSLTLNTTTGVISGIPNAVGVFTITDTAKNISGSAIGTITITINPAVPIVSSGSVTGTAGSLFIYTINATNSPTSYNSTALPGGLTINTTTGIISGTPTTAGTFTISDTAKNISGAGTGTVTIHITAALPPPAPVITTGSTTGAEGAAFSYSIIASNSPTGYSTATLPAGLSLNIATGVISGIPTTAGVFTVIDTAKNAGGIGTGTVTITIHSIAGPVTGPIITSTGFASGVVGTPFAYTITSNNGVTYNAIGLPAGLSVNTATGAITGVPTVSGVTQVHITATNSIGGTITNDLTITITVPVAPVIYSATSVSVNEGEAFAYTIEAQNLPTSFAALNLPAGLSINTATGEIGGIPAIAGSYAITIEAINAVGKGTAILNLTVEQDEASAPPTTSGTSVLWPNPVLPGGIVTVTLPGWQPTDTQANIEVIDFSGKTVENVSNVTIEYSSTKDAPMVKVEVLNLLQGDYMMIIRSNDDKVVQKFMVQ